MVPPEKNALPVAPFRYGVLAFLIVMAAIAYIQRNALSVPLKEVARDLAFTDLTGQMGNVQFTWGLAYAVMQMPGGWFADRVGSRHALAIFCFVWSAATLFTGFATGYGSLLVLWAFMGAAQAGAFPCAAKAIGQTFGDHERARASGLLAGGMTIGGALAPTFAASLLGAFEPLAEWSGGERWRWLLVVFAIPGLLWTLVFLLSVPKTLLPVGADSLSPSKTRGVDWSRLANASLVLLCGQQFFRAAAMVFFGTWFPTFLQNTRDVSVGQSGYLTTVAGIGAVVGSFTGGFFSDYVLKITGNPRLSRQGIAVLGMAGSAVCFVAAYFTADVWLCIALIALGAFSATFGGVSGYTVAITFGGRQVATVFSIMNTCGNVGAALFPLAAGWLVKRTGDWNGLLLLFAGIMAVDAVCWAFLNPREPLFGDDDAPR